VHDVLGAVVVEQVLAVRLGVLENQAVDDRRAGREPTLRAGDGDRMSREAAAVHVGQPVQGVALRHRPQAVPSGWRVRSYSASMSILRWWRASPENGVARNSSTMRSASSAGCIRAPIPTTWASLC